MANIKYVRSIVPNYQYELSRFIDKDSDWIKFIKKHSGFKTPFRKFFVRMTKVGFDILFDKDSIAKKHTDREWKLFKRQCLKMIDKKYEKFGWRYTKISKEEFDSIFTEGLDCNDQYLEIFGLEKYISKDLRKK